MALWTPAEITTALWLDASDTATFMLDAALITEWRDKSGSARHASQSVAGSKPGLVTGGLGGLDVASFDGSADFLTLASDLAITTDMVVVMVMGRPTAATISQPMGGTVTGGTPYPAQWWTDNIAYAGLGSSYTTHGTASTAKGFFVISASRSATQVIMRRNGTQLGTPQTAPTVGTATLTYVGRRGLNYHKGTIAEIVVCHAAEDVDRIEGYLAWKWGMQENLPIGHPYKAAAPGMIGSIRLVALLDQVWGDSPVVSAELSQPWGIKMGVDLHQAWTDASVIRAMLSQPWGNASVLRAELRQRWESSFTLRATLDQNWHVFGVVQAELAQRWAITADLVRRVLEQGWDLRERDLLRAELLQRWAIEADGAVLRYQVAVGIDGFAVGFSHLNIEGGIDQDVLSCELHLGSEGDYLRCRMGSEIAVSITSAAGTEAFVFVITAPRITEEHGNTQYIVEAMSPAVLLGEPYADPIEGELSGLASTIAATLAGSAPLAWQTVDWEIPPSTWIAAGETPLALLKTLAAAVGAVVQSLPDGSLVIMPEWPVSINQLGSVTPALTLVENLDCWTTGSTPELKSGYNRFLIGDQLTTANTLRLDEESISDTVKIVRGYQTPWTGNFDLAHTGGDWVVIEPLGIEERQETETIEIVAGAGRVQYPIYSRDLVEWGQVNLGSVTVAEDGSVQAAIAEESLLTITYTTRCKKWQVRDPRNEQLQLVVPA